MSAFNFPNPPVADGTEVTNSATGVTYKYDLASDSWNVVSTEIAVDINGQVSQLSADIARIDGLIVEELEARDELIEDATDLNASQESRLNALEAANVTYQIGTDKVMRAGDPAIELVDSAGYYSNVKFSGTGGISVSSDLQSIIIDGSNIDAGGGDVQLSMSQNTNRIDIKVNDSLDLGISLPAASDYLAGLMTGPDRKHIYTWNKDNYYSKEEIDNQFTLRGVGYNYLLSSTGGTATIRDGEFHTDNRLAGQISFISIAPKDDDGKVRRDAVVGDTIELADVLTGMFYRYEITDTAVPEAYAVTYVGAEVNRNDPLGIGYPFLIYLYPTHINSANYYDKAESDDRFMSLKPGTQQYCQRMINFAATVDYTGTVQYANNIVNKRYVDEALAGRATVQYVNDEVDKMLTSFNTEDAEPDIFYGDYAPTGEMKNGNVWFDSMNLRMNVWSQGAWINPDREGDSVDLSPYQKIVSPPGRKFKKANATTPGANGTFTYYETNGQIKLALNRRDAEGVKWLDIDFSDTLAAPVLFRIVQWQNNTSHHTIRYGAIDKIVATAGGQVVCDVRYHQTNGSLADNSNYFITIGGLI